MNLLDLTSSSVAIALRNAKSEGAAKHFEQLAAEIESGVVDEHRTALLEKYRSELAKWGAEVKYALEWKRCVHVG